MSNHSASPLEPSMEDILASIRRIIAEEDEQEARSARRVRAEAEEAAARAEAPPARVEPPRLEPSRPEPSRPDPSRPEPPRPETRRFRFEEPSVDLAPTPAPAPPPNPAPPPAPVKVDWSGLGVGARDPEPPAPSRPAPRPALQDERLDEEFGWAERALGRTSPAPEPESRFEFEIPFRDSGDADLDADFGAILKSAAPKAEPPPPRVVEGAYGGRFVEEPPRPVAPPPRPAPVAPPPAPPLATPAAEDPFARFLTPPPSAFDDGYTLDPEAELLSGFKTEAADLGRKTEEAASAARRSVVDSADEAEAFLRRSASENFADLTEFAGGAAQTAKSAGRSAFDAAADFAAEAGGSADFLFDKAEDAASNAASSLVEGARSAGRSVFETASDLTSGAGRALDKAADHVAEHILDPSADFAADLTKEAAASASDLAEGAFDAVKDAGGSAFDVAADLTKGAGRFFGETLDAGADFAAESAKEAADLAGEAAKAVGEAGRSAVKAVAEKAEEAIPELPVFEPPKFDLPDFASLREEASRTVETTRREVDDIFGAFAEAPAEALKEAEAFGRTAESFKEPSGEEPSGAVDLGEPLDVFGVDRFSREDLDEGVLNLSSDRRIPEAPPAEASAAEPPPFDVNSFWGSDSDFEPNRDPASPLDIPPAPTEPESGFVREELLLTERLGESEDPAALWETAAAATGIAAASSASTALTTRAPAPPAALSARRSLIEDEDLLSEAAERASARAMAALTGAQAPRLHGGFPLPGAEGEAESLNAVVRQMLKPMLREWLDENLPSMVERLVRAEVERVSARAAWSDQN